MKRILLLAISTLLSCVPRKSIKDIQITGSIANGEGTVITTGSQIISSDLDLLVFVKLNYYLTAMITGLGQRLNKMVTSELVSRGIRTHVCFTICSGMIERITTLIGKSSIYCYEFNYNKSLMGKKIRERPCKPSREDSLQLLFTVLAESTLVYPKLTLLTERLYWLAKRYLTTLYSLLILKGKARPTYADRVRSALDLLPQETLSRADSKLAVACLRFKLTGKPQEILRVFPSQDLGRVIALLEIKLREQVSKTLNHELSVILSEKMRSNSVTNFAYLLESYFARTKQPIAKILTYIYLLTILFVVTRRSNTGRVIKLVSFFQHSLIIAADFLVGLTFLAKLGYRKASDYLDRTSGVLATNGMPMSVRELWLLADELKQIQ